MNTIEKEYGNKLEGLMIEDNIQSLKRCPKCNDLIMQELPNLVNTKLSEGERKQFFTWSCYSCRTETMSYQSK
jgi:uncharacterized protein with PIN domain